MTWQKSSFSGGGDGNNCVEVAATGTGLLLREGDEPDVTLAPTPHTLARLLAHIKVSG
ncbi:DUF397 domain-containing protein [Streptomyces boncukensis]|uniref:DUF397 domain-containing protein n=1 Tax=Streptomyces boncukensis TaxID=2711219 RepID=A0A6G4X5T9_9ACTN|nr:DUF397 domain-containing protein [Streptomyces boncukensis]